MHSTSRKIINTKKCKKCNQSLIIKLFSTQDKIDLGELMMSLCYLPTAGRLTLTVIKARNLKKMDITGSSGV